MVLDDVSVALILGVPKLVQSAVMGERKRMVHDNTYG